ncbi:PQQ-binding-like beta-propeller repeat protein [Paenibacillus sp. MMS20-IR301]|uniref:outer membrane protein assembly factor BamB family protein n=1 Tax=Paenibacillus sp. MMS20-IR301 TaxID=2895946 RepID=UPI0028E457EE|nr:PQQ-binding-like beta-propeller repeat protein [Paenibacillus sp. MMS20-IR301]WNS45054.1 PQQ-binding-like beta-propeller repeat protein [Paenibacillus sp. MMS20-IR301]
MPPIQSLLTPLLFMSLLSSTALTTMPDITRGSVHTTLGTTSITSAAKDSLVPLKWKAAANGMGMYDSKPPVSNGILYYSDINSTLYAKNIASGKMEWSYPQGGHPQIVTNNSVFFIDHKERLVKVSAATGKVIWKVKVADQLIEIGAQARLMNGTIYFANESGGVTAYDPVSGKRLWDNKEIPMYAGTIYGEYRGVLVVSSTVNNIRSQFYGLDPASGKKLWRIEGLYSYVNYENGQLLLREQTDYAAKSPSAPVPGYQLTLARLNPVTGKITARNNYNKIADISKIRNNFTIIQDSYVYSADMNPDTDRYTLTRFLRGADAEAATTSYEQYGSWLAGPAGGIAYFQQDNRITALNLADDSVTSYNVPAGKALHLQRVGKAVFTLYNNGYIAVHHYDTGALLGMIEAGSTYPSFGNITLHNGTALIPTEHHIIAVALPQQYQ